MAAFLCCSCNPPDPARGEVLFGQDFILFLFGGGACSLLFVVFVCSGIVLLFDYMRVSNYSTFTTIYAYTKKRLVSATARSRV